jgi:hypothetical protein
MSKVKKRVSLYDWYAPALESAVSCEGLPSKLISLDFLGIGDALKICIPQSEILPGHYLLIIADLSIWQIPDKWIAKRGVDRTPTFNLRLSKIVTGWISRRNPTAPTLQILRKRLAVPVYAALNLQASKRPMPFAQWLTYVHLLVLQHVNYIYFNY